ncbi:UNVERIFIED_CONTAM: hypothetical protein RMT77_009107 [Armadillidium vulgare]
MNMGRKKSKRSTKDTTRQNLSDTPSGNSASTALIGGGSSQSTSRNVASADAIRNKSLQSISRNTSLELNPNFRHITSQMVFGGSPSLTSQSTSRNTASVTVPKNPRVSSQTTKNSASGSVKGKSSQSATRSASTLMLEKQKDSSEIASRSLAAAGDSLHSTSRSKASGAAKGISLQSTATGTASVGDSRGGSSRSTARGTTSIGAAQGRSLQSTTTGTASTGSGRDGSSQSTVKSLTPVDASLGGSIESRTRSTDSVGASRGRSLQSTTRSTVSATMPAAGRIRTEETNSRRSAFIGTVFIDNARRETSLPTTRNSTSVTSPVASQTTQTNVERRNPILYPIFFVIKNVDGSEVNVIEIENILGRLECITPLKDRSMLIKTKSQSESNIISNLTTICNKPVSVVPHSSLNSSQGTVFGKGLQMCSNEEILDHLRSQHVTKVYHFRKKVNGIHVDTPRLLLTFDTPQPPKQIKVGFLQLQVRLFSPTPRRCFNCQSFTHISKYCTATPVCPLCGETGHTYPPRCNNPIKCVNCLSDDHTATSSECDTFKIEKKVLELHARKKIGIAEARLRIANQILSGRLKV